MTVTSFSPVKNLLIIQRSDLSFPVSMVFATRDDREKGLWKQAEVKKLAFNLTPKYHIFLRVQTVIQITNRKLNMFLGKRC